MRSETTEVTGGYSRHPAGRGAQQPGTGAAQSPFAFVARHWFWTLLSTAVAATAAFFVAQQFATERYLFQAQLLYHRNSSGAPDYESPNLGALIPMLESREVLAAARDELSLNADLADIQESMELEIPYDSSLLKVSLEWPNEKTGPALLGEVVDAFVSNVAATRMTTLKQLSRQFDSTIVDLEDRLRQTHAELKSFNERIGVVDVDRDVTNLQSDIRFLESSVAATRARKEGREAQLEAISSPEDAPNAVAGQAAADLQRHKILGDLIKTGEDKLTREVQLEYNRRQLERAKALHEKQYISDAEFDQVRAQYQSLAAGNSATLDPLRNQMASIEKRIPSVVNGNSLSAAMFSAGLSPAMTIELSLIESQSDLDYLEKSLDEKQSQLRKLVSAREEGRALDDKIRVLRAERDRMEARKTDFQKLMSPDAVEFSVIQPPSLALDPVTSNARKWMLAVFVGFMAVLLGPVVLWDMFRIPPEPSAQTWANGRTVRSREPTSSTPTMSRPLPL